MLDQRTPSRIDAPRGSLLRGRVRRTALALATAALCAVAGGEVVVAASPADPCGGRGGRTVACPVFPQGAPVQGPNGRIRGRLASGAHAVYCQRRGGMLRSGTRRSNSWAITQADNGKWGWVSAVYTRGATPKPRFKLVPPCPLRFGAPPALRSTNEPSATTAPGDRGAPETPVDPGDSGEPATGADPGEPGDPAGPANTGEPLAPGDPA